MPALEEHVPRTSFDELATVTELANVTEPRDVTLGTERTHRFEVVDVG